MNPARNSLFVFRSAFFNFWVGEIEVFREAQIKGWSLNEQQKRLKQRWDELSDSTENNRFVDSAGRRWTDRNYISNLVTTTSARTARESYHDTLVENGDDLAMVQNVGDNCPICAAFDGVIYSISGSTRRYPTYTTIKRAGVFHNRCDCLPIRVDEDIHEEQIAAQRGAATLQRSWWKKTKSGRTTINMENVLKIRKKAGLPPPKKPDPVL